ncbi:cell surface glycoprotein 1-like isoform X2 [Halichondria panicea]|uniref:cell surface glycoprotein 1-like isoform X2 n=1 Tax=Halichondria panicea TaxID=6063 RepID=UPI00312B5B38
MMQQQVKLLLALAALLGAANAQRGCPNQVDCTDDPCATATCPSFMDTECRVNNCSGECTADFFTTKGSRDVNVTNNCFKYFETCKEDTCNIRRKCMTYTPEVCKNGRICQNIRCEIESLPPLTCEDLVCTDDKTKCETTQTTRGTQARCVVSIPDNCDEKKCDEGMVCEVRTRGKDGVQVARCVADKKDSTNPRRGATCAEVECDEDEVCLMLSDDNGARCANPPPPTDCSQLQCEQGMDCLPTENKKRVRCVRRKEPFGDSNPTERPSGATPLPVLARSCDQLDCEPGYSCRMVANKAKNGNRQPLPTCKPDECPTRKPRGPPRSCRQLECGREEVCVTCGEGEKTRARCLATERPNMRQGNTTNPGRLGNHTKPRNTTSGNGTRPTGKPVRPTRPSGNGTRPTGRPVRPTRPSGNGTRPTGGRPTGRPVRPTRPSGNGTRPTGRPTVVRPTRPSGNGTRPTGRPVRPTRPSGNGTRPTGGRPTGRPNRPRNATTPDQRANRCKEAECRRGFRCIQVRRGERQVPTCVRVIDEVCRLGPEQREIFGKGGLTKPDEREDGKSKFEEGDMEEDDETPERPNKKEEGDDETEDDEESERRNKKEEGDDETEDEESERRNKKEEGDNETEDDEESERRNKNEEGDDETEDNEESERRNKKEEGDDETEDDDKDEDSSTPRPRPRPTNLRLPDLCSERACCPGEKCYISSTEGGRPRLAFCAPAGFTGEVPPGPPSPTCEELECGERFECRERKENGLTIGRCARKETDGPQPTGRPTVRPTRPSGNRTRPTGGRPTDRPSGNTDKPRPTGGRPTGRPSGNTDKPRPTGGKPTDRPSGNTRPTGGKPTDRPSGNTRPTGGKPTGRPSGNTDKPRPTGERPSNRPTARPRPQTESKPNPTRPSRPNPTRPSRPLKPGR